MISFYCFVGIENTLHRRFNNGEGEKEPERRQFSVLCCMVAKAFFYSVGIHAVDRSGGHMLSPMNMPAFHGRSSSMHLPKQETDCIKKRQ